LRTKEKNLKRKRALLTRFNSQAPPWPASLPIHLQSSECFHLFCFHI
jgi:hypothetical protein